MNLKNVKLVKEDKDAFHVQGPKDAAPFKIAKKGLSPTLHGQIAQHFADGGEVDASDDPSGAFSLMNQSVADAGGSTVGLPGSPAPAVSPDQEAANYSAATQNVANRDAGTPLIAPEVKTGDGTGEEVTPAPAAAAAPQNAAPAAPGLDINALGKGLMVGSGVAPGYESGMKGAVGEQQKSVQASADAAAKQAAETQKAQQDTLAQLQNEDAQYKQQMAAHQASVQKLQQDIATSKVDPGQFWKKKGTAAKIGAALAAGLAGWGAALNHQENPVTKILNNAVDQDIEAQKTNLDQKNNSLRQLMEQGHTLQEAEQLERSKKLGMLAGQTQAIASKYAGPQAQAAAQNQIAELTQKSQAISQGVYSQKSAAAAQNAKTKLQLLQLGAAAQQQGNEGDLVERARTGRLSPSETYKLGKSAGNVLWTTEERPVVGQDGKQIVGPDGQPMTHLVHESRLAADDKAAEKARPVLEETNNMSGKVRALDQIMREHPKGTWTAATNTAAQSALNDIKLSFMKAQEGVGKQPGPAELAMMDKMIADPTSAYDSVSGKNTAAISFLKRTVANSKKAALDAYAVPRE